jgi:hypothetical protein
LAEDGRADGVHADEPQVRAEIPEDAGDSGGMPAGAHGTDQHVDPAELGDEFQRE